MIFLAMTAPFRQAYGAAVSSCGHGGGGFSEGLGLQGGRCEAPFRQQPLREPTRGSGIAALKEWSVSSTTHPGRAAISGSLLVSATYATLRGCQSVLGAPRGVGGVAAMGSMVKTFFTVARGKFHS